MRDTELLDKWLSASKALVKAGEDELKYRNLILPKVMDGKQNGSKTTLFGGHKVTGTARINYQLDPAALSALMPALTDDEKACINWKPSLKAREYQKLADHSNLQEVVTAKPGQGQLKIV